MTEKKRRASEGPAHQARTDEGVLRDATLRFDSARASGDYAAAMDAAFSSEDVDKALNDSMSREILAGRLPEPRAAIHHLENLVFWGKPVPHVLALHIADLAQGKNLGRRPKTPSQVVQADRDLTSVIDELVEPFVQAGMKKTEALTGACERFSQLCKSARAGSIPDELVGKDALARVAARQTGHGAPSSILRAYRRAYNRLTPQGPQKS